MSKRVVITGMGAVTPIGNNVNDFWKNAKNGIHGFERITKFDPDLHKVTIGAEVKDYEYHDKKEGRRMDLFTQYGVTATYEALEDSGLVCGENIDPQRFNIIVGSGIGGIMTVENEVVKGHTKGFSKVSPMLVPKIIGNILPGYISIIFGMQGASYDIVTACATGTQAVGEAFRQIKHGYADAVVAGASEAPFAPASFAGFENMKAMSTSTDKDRASIPFDKERSGFIMGEGAGILIVEELEHALNRNAEIYAEIVGYGNTTDAHHITAPQPEGNGSAKSMSDALAEANLKPADISYINAHGTGTPMNDLFETNAIKKVFGDNAKNIPISSTKSMIGHSLSSAGSIEAIVCIKALKDNFVPPTVGYKVPDEELDLDYVPNKGREAKLEVALSNSLGFGGHNGTIIIKDYK